jgi:hypothetical protein
MQQSAQLGHRPQLIALPSCTAQAATQPPSTPSPPPAPAHPSRRAHLRTAGRQDILLRPSVRLLLQPHSRAAGHVLGRQGIMQGEALLATSAAPADAASQQHAAQARDAGCSTVAGGAVPSVCDCARPCSGGCAVCTTAPSECGLGRSRLLARGSWGRSWNVNRATDVLPRPAPSRPRAAT